MSRETYTTAAGGDQPRRIQVNRPDRWGALAFASTLINDPTAHTAKRTAPELDNNSDRKMLLAFVTLICLIAVGMTLFVIDAVELIAYLQRTGSKGAA